MSARILARRLTGTGVGRHPMSHGEHFGIKDAPRGRWWRRRRRDTASPRTTPRPRPISSARIAPPESSSPSTWCSPARVRRAITARDPSRVSSSASRFLFRVVRRNAFQENASRWPTRHLAAWNVRASRRDSGRADRGARAAFVDRSARVRAGDALETGADARRGRGEKTSRARKGASEAHPRIFCDARRRIVRRVRARAKKVIRQKMQGMGPTSRRLVRRSSQARM